MTAASLARRTLLVLAGSTLALAPTLIGCQRASDPPPPVSSSAPAGTTTTPEPVLTSTTRPADPSGTASGTPQERRARFLDSLREAGVPVSRSGDSEVLIAEGVCGRLALGVSENDLVKEIEAMGGVWTPANALAVVRSAGTNYCTV